MLNTLFLMKKRSSIYVEKVLIFAPVANREQSKTVYMKRLKRLKNDY